MKTNKTPLLKKINQHQLLFGITIVFLSLVILYFLTRYYIETETQESLNTTSHRIEQLLERNQNVSSLSPVFEVEEILKLQPDFIKDTIIFDELQHENELFREMNTFKTINGKNYHVVTRELLVEYDDTLWTIILSFAIIISLVSLSQFFYGKYISKLIWKPFFHNLELMKSFSVNSNDSINLIDSNILEFSDLNTEIGNLTTKVRTDYQNLKQFTEDISHEVQTPLSIIQAKIENLLNDFTQFDDEQVRVLYDIQKNTSRLSKLNKGLILLTKIENAQFTTLETVDVNKTIHTLLEHLEDISNIKEIQIQIDEIETSQIKMDKVLADVLFSNLIGNAIKHTEQRGAIHIIIHSKRFLIVNSGDRSISDEALIFERFYKENKHSNSLGLGLAIAKKVVDYYGFKIIYTFHDNQHQFEITFI